MNLYNQVSKDEYFLDIYNQIDNIERDLKLWAGHGIKHVNNVVKIVKTIMESLNYNQEEIDKAMAAAFLHDVGCLYGKDNLGVNSYKIVKEYLEKNKLQLDNDLLMAIKHHSNHRILKSSIAPILRFADKIDITKNRLTNEGFKVKGMRQYQYIEDIIITINEKFIVNFIINENVNMLELERFYFTKKVVTTIKEFAKKINREYQILINGQNWDI